MERGDDVHRLPLRVRVCKHGPSLRRVRRNVRCVGHFHVEPKTFHVPVVVSHWAGTPLGFFRARCKLPLYAIVLGGRVALVLAHVATVKLLGSSARGGQYDDKGQRAALLVIVTMLPWFSFHLA